ncbi:MAG: DNA polymerase III subunit beta [Anaerolineales bacterium]|nr:DNA polymerase III subunit beta [Anaerolineales bacterium]MCW5855443.1 DNA polymerase III subunit beta [Anaerolineales bacterium]
MKISVLQENLAQGLNIVSRAVSPRSTHAILANVLIAAEDGRLKLSATDRELGITAWIGAKIEEPGATTVPARTLADLVATFPNDTIHMELAVRTQTLQLSAGRSHAEIKGIDAQEFPPMPEPDKSAGIELNAGDFKEMIGQVVFAASRDDARPVLTGVLVTVEGDTITMAAADGFRLSVRKAKLAAPLDQPLRAIVPARALNELARIASDDKEQIHMVLPAGRGQIVFSLKNAELRCQLVEGAFPEYNQIIPNGHKTRTVVSAGAFLKAAKQSEIFARESSHIARLDIKPGDNGSPGTVEISAQSEETGSNDSKIDAIVEGQEILIAFNVRYLREALDVMKSSDVALETTAPAAPGVIRPVGDQDFLHVIMPMHLGK